ncbi:MAG: metallophosphoesterase [Pseudomonadota bacterium]
MRLLAISDLHLANKVNKEALDALPAFPDDWLVVAGDVGEKFAHLRAAFETLTARFERIIWTPGNHELWAVPEGDAPASAGVERHEKMVAIAREYGVITPEDEFPLWEGPGGPAIVAPVFTLYDYTFRPPEVSAEEVIGWAREGGIRPADELHLSPAPFPSRAAWCAERVRATEARLETLPAGARTVLVNHFPLRRDLVAIPRVPRFTPWCGTILTEDWHTRFGAAVVVSGHLHVRRTDWRDGTRFEEVSLGYPRQWDQRRGMAAYLRQILPEPTGPFEWARRTMSSIGAGDT